MQARDLSIKHEAKPAEHGVRRDDESGSALVMVVITVLLIMVFSAVTMTVVTTHGREHQSSFEHLRCLYLAETAIEMANMSLNDGGTGAIGTEAAFTPLGDGEVWVTAEADESGTYALRARARLNGVTQIVTAITEPSNQVFDHAMFAGNSSGDPNYVMEFSGSGSEADEINGDVYSGQDIDVGGDSAINGEVRVSGTATGVDDYIQTSQPIPDIAGMQYEINHDVDVAAEFAAHGHTSNNPAGGWAGQVPASNEAHVFRLNPTDRSSECAGTTKDDYFLEDPYEVVRRDVKQDGSDAYQVSFGVMGDHGQQNKVFYIDGNVWFHNIPTYSFQMADVPGGNQITLAVRGNIYISDNLFYGNADFDGLALIALIDPDVPDSGNIYFGDPRGGTLEVMDGFMYAENNFYDLNLQSSGSTHVTLNGTMSAGNQVLIDRDHRNHHTKLIINYDDRLTTGELNMPGIPGNSASAMRYTIINWRREGGGGE